MTALLGLGNRDLRRHYGFNWKSLKKFFFLQATSPSREGQREFMGIRLILFDSSNHFIP